MILAVSRFRVERGAEGAAFAPRSDRADLISQAPGFLGAETFRCGKDATKLLLMTRWADEDSFRQWLSDLWPAWSTQSFPGMTIDPELPEPVVLARIGEHALDLDLADARQLLTWFLRDAQSLYFLRADAQGTILSCNGSWSELLGISTGQLAGSAIWALLTEHDADQLRGRVRDRLRRPQERFLLNVCDVGNAPHTLECHLDVGPDGGFILLGEAPHAAESRLRKELVGLNRELTLMARERGRAQAQAEAAERERSELLGREQQARLEAEQANRTKDVFLGMVSHELRNPLSGILYWAELLDRGVLDEAVSRRAVEAILRNVRTQIRLVEDLLDATRITSGTLRMSPRLVDPSAVVDAAVEAVRPSAEKKRIDLAKSVDGPAVLLQADASRLEQALVNLLGNAVKFTPDQGRVEVRLERSESEVRFRVADTGAGIEPGLLATLFDPFRQGSIHGERSSGLGLGLAITRRIVELHGGEIEAESPGPGKGAVFTVRIPRSGL